MVGHCEDDDKEDERLVEFDRDARVVYYIINARVIRDGPGCHQARRSRQRRAMSLLALRRCLANRSIYRQTRRWIVSGSSTTPHASYAHKVFIGSELQPAYTSKTEYTRMSSNLFSL